MAHKNNYITFKNTYSSYTLQYKNINKNGFYLNNYNFQTCTKISAKIFRIGNMDLIKYKNKFTEKLFSEFIL